MNARQRLARTLCIAATLVEGCGDPLTLPPLDATSVDRAVTESAVDSALADLTTRDQQAEVSPPDVASNDLAPDLGADASPPDVVAADALAPDAATPDAVTPDAATPDAVTPDMVTPDAVTPDAATPDAATPDAPAMDATDASAPDVPFDAARDVTPDVSAVDAGVDAPAPDAPATDSPAPDGGWATNATLVPSGGLWRYLDDGSDPGTAWRAQSFSDAAWRSGRAQFGYGDGDEATVVRFGPDPNNKFVTTYFRANFTVTDPAEFASLTLRLLRDDGAVVYLNGTEVARSNMRAGAVITSTLATATVPSGEESAFFAFAVPTERLVRGSNTLAVEVHQYARDSSDLSFDLSLSGTRAVTAPSGDPVLLGAGDISRCDTDADEFTARLLDAQPGTVFALGDNVYNDGTDQEFVRCYEPTWGRHFARTRPVVGNHEYQTPGAAGYFRYFGVGAGNSTEGWYSFELGAWHIVVLNSNCTEVGGCAIGSAQDRWLRADLAAHPSRCTMALWHHPRFSSGASGSSTAVQPFWQALYDAGADVVLTGHDHNYERFAPMRPDGTADNARGLREFVVGTGGATFTGISRVASNSEVRNTDTFGVLKITLHPAAYDWEFLPVAGRTFRDRGSELCR